MSDPQTVSTATPDVLIGEVPTTPVSKQKQIEPPAKRPRFDKSSSRNTSKRHGGVAYTREDPVTSLQLTSRIIRFPIFTSNNGVTHLAQYMFTAIQGRDFRLANAITLLQLEYALAISFCNRIVQVSINYGYAFPLHASRLKQIASGIQLPTLLCQYIEALGDVELLNGAHVVPYAADYHRLFPPNTTLMRDPAAILEEANRPVPEEPWALDPEWIVAYNDATTRASKSGMKFRSVDNADYRGRSEIVVSLLQRDMGMIEPISPQILTEAEGQLGATYEFRNYADREHWFGLHHELMFHAFGGTPFEPRVLFSDLCVAAFRGATVSTE